MRRHAIATDFSPRKIAFLFGRDFRPEADKILAGGVSHRYQYATDTARRATQLSLSANAIVPPSGLLLSSAKLPVAYAGLRHRQRLFRPPGWIYY